MFISILFLFCSDELQLCVHKIVIYCLLNQNAKYNLSSFVFKTLKSDFKGFTEFLKGLTHSKNGCRQHFKRTFFNLA